MNNHYVDSTHYSTDTILQGKQRDIVSPCFKLPTYLVKKINQIFILQKITYSELHEKCRISQKDFVDNRGKKRRHSIAMTRLFNEEYRQKIFLRYTTPLMEFRINFV